MTTPEATPSPEAPKPPDYIRKFERYAALKANWTFSNAFIQHLRDRLSNNLSSNVITIGLAGSFGRLEGSKSSDADYILVVADKSHDGLERDQDTLRGAIADYGVAPPNKSGVFSEPRTKPELLKSPGRVGEEVDELGKRMLLLLESRSIYNDTEYETLISELFSQYARYPVADTDKEYVFLLNDLIRYFRYICVNYQASFFRENEKWVIRNIKLRHSRVIMYAGLLFLLGEASKHLGEGKIAVVQNSLGLTPLERIAMVYERNNDHGFFRVVGLYNVFLSRISDDAFRKRLNVEYDQRYTLPEFAELKANSDALAAELVRFVLARRGQWSERFFEYLIF